MEIDKDIKLNYGITEGLIEELRGYSHRAEQDGTLTSEQLAIIYERKWFKLFVPKKYGGLELTVPEGVRLEEKLAQIDGSLGWTVTLCGGANLFVGYLDQSIAASIFLDPRVCFGGSGQASGNAIIKNGGYEVTGKWRYATGGPHNNWFTANCTLEQDGKPIVDENGLPLVKSFFFAVKDVRIIEDWQVFGLKATASHSFEVEKLWVPKNQSFVILPERATLDNPLYRYPFVPFAEATLAANTLGMAQHFLACCDTLLKSHDAARTKLDEAERKVQDVRAHFYHALDNSWEELCDRKKVSEERLHDIASLSRKLVMVSREQVMILYPYCGMVAADPTSTINRVWRDIFTASQHKIFR